MRAAVVIAALVLALLRPKYRQVVAALGVMLAVAGFGFGATLWVKLAGSWGHLLANIGLGFMLIEIVLIQKALLVMQHGQVFRLAGLPAGVESLLQRCQAQGYFTTQVMDAGISIQEVYPFEKDFSIGQLIGYLPGYLQCPLFAEPGPY